jgi:L-iditol 2-dehydrogenase
MRAAFLRKSGELYLDDIPVPLCTEGSVLVQVKEIGVCGSDLHYFNEGRIGDHIVVEPHILGHEASGIVVETGSGVTGFAKGDRVSIEPGIPCMSCDRCREGRYNLCPDVRFSGAPPYQGMFREFLVHDPRFIHKLPDSVSYTQGALVEPLAVAHNAVKKAALRPGETILITGVGPIGLSCVEMARVAGAVAIFVSDPKAHRRKAALSLKALYAVDPKAEDLVEAVNRWTGGRMVDCVIEASGDESAIGDTIRCIRKGGRVVFVGMGRETQTIPHAEILRKEAVLSGIYRYVNDFQPVIALLAAGMIGGEAWVSHRFRLEDIVEAVNLANDALAETLKVVVHT